MDIKEYKCPNCGGSVKFDASSQGMKCPYCDAEFEIDALEEYQKDLLTVKNENIDWKNSAGKTWEKNELDDLLTGSCPSCGAELMGDKDTAAMVCPSCGNSQIVIKRLEGLLKPDYVIPFKLEKKAAVEALKNFYLKKRLLPDFFKEENRVNNVQGVYFPFWLFDAGVDAIARYKASRTRAWSDSRYNYIKTDYYSVIRDGSLSFEKIPVDGSEKMDDDFMDAIEPFNYSEMRDFQTAYLSGYLAEKYDVDAAKSKERARERIKSSVETEFAKTVTGYSSVVMESSSVNIRDGKASYAFFPVWVLNTKYKNANYLFLMNGQTGRLIGRLPSDSAKIVKYLFLITCVIGAVLTAAIQALRILL